MEGGLFLKRWLVLICAALLLLYSAGRPEAPVLSYGFNDTFDTYICLRGYDMSEAQFSALCREARRMFVLLDQQLDPCGQKTPASLSAFNDSQGGRLALVPDLLLRQCLAFQQETGGAFSPSLGPLNTLWRQQIRRYAGGEGPLPLKSDVAGAAALCADPVLQADGSWELPPGASVDLSAAAKGVAAELTAQHLEALGYGNFVIDAGGNLRVSRLFSPRRPIHMTVEGGKSNFSVPVRGGMAAATSGGAVRGYSSGGVRLHHLIDPATGWPAGQWLSVSVICSDAGLADRLSTALFCMDQKAGAALCRRYGAAALWAHADGAVTCNRAMARLCPGAAKGAPPLS